MKTVDIFCGTYGEQNALGIDVRREWKLDENTVDVVALIEIGDDL